MSLREGGVWVRWVDRTRGEKGEGERKNKRGRRERDIEGKTHRRRGDHIGEKSPEVRGCDGEEKRKREWENFLFYSQKNEWTDIHFGFILPNFKFQGSLCDEMNDRVQSTKQRKWHLLLYLIGFVVDE